MKQAVQGRGDEGIGIVLLAAGASTRMGTPKQLLKLQGISLIRRATENALASPCRPVVVVLGANADRIAPELDGLPTETVVNREWSKGISSSIHCGLSRLLAISPEIKAVLFLLADQPNVTGTSLTRLADAYFQSRSELVAARYSGQVGTPALFSRSYFDELLNIEGPGGAKALLRLYADRVFPVDSPEAAVDLDTPGDLADFLPSESISESALVKGPPSSLDHQFGSL